MEKIRQECMSEGDEAGEVHFDFFVEVGKVKLLGNAEVVILHDSCVEKDTVDVGRLLHNPKLSGHKMSTTALHLSWVVRHTYLAANQGISSRLLMSNWTALDCVSPWFRTNSSRRSLRRPTTVTWAPDWTSRAASAWPMPDVAPTTKKCLYGKDMAMVFQEIDCAGMFDRVNIE